ncbi:hypothetical protein [Nostoc parmelioides]|uniref:Uncharacterized protein n=1 Tax=Nostoc parmelioides FACHB-3921 TaxID=2692909 RepID=A0ABR8BNX8_9NOSO|nr:hypothetical protein [Nostoc parmelioides]MBD2254620.1 hypothetical protein [Nostoc parmelioides FACHB-3921]
MDDFGNGTNVFHPRTTFASAIPQITPSFQNFEQINNPTPSPDTAASSPPTPLLPHPACTQFPPTSQSQSSASSPTRTTRSHPT